jgi:CheY-like chemotaxis protein
MNPASSPSGGKWRILCIDDEPDILDILRVTLELKHEVVTARDGIEAVGMLDLCDADFVICDVRMPQMDGFQTVEAIRRHPRYTAIPVFFLTAETSAEMAKRGFASGCNLYLTKPFDPMRVLQNIDYFLQESGMEPRAKRHTPQEIEEEARRAKEISAAPPPAAAVEPVAAVEPAKVRIIVVCNVQDQLHRFHAALAKRYECVACADPLASLQQMFRYDPDILIINPAIPQLSGWGLVQMIRQNSKLKALPILLVDDPAKPLDRRFVPAITDQPLLSATAGEGAVLDSVRHVVQTPGFRLRPKRATLQQLTAEEEQIRRTLLTEQVKRQGQERLMRDRFRRIQDFIDKNLA